MLMCGSNKNSEIINRFPAKYCAIRHVTLSAVTRGEKHGLGNITFRHDHVINNGTEGIKKRGRSCLAPFKDRYPHPPELLKFCRRLEA